MMADERPIMEDAEAARWCILRTHGGRTLALAKSLADAGIAAWTPVEQIRRRIPRSKTKEQVFRAVPYMPTYVFAPDSDLGELRRLEAALNNPHPGFSIFRHCGATVRVSDAEVQRLRRMEDESQRRMRQSLKERAEPLPPGTTVALGGAFAGLAGIVEESDGRHTLLLFGTALRVTIETSTLRQDGVAEAPSAA
nr:hypothetical protein [uncultured Sphingomonas sp.]